MRRRIESFCWRIEQQIGEGGFALAIDDPGDFGISFSTSSQSLGGQSDISLDSTSP
jgi:hypothetical protein